VLVGVTQRVDRVDSYEEFRDALDQRLIDWVVEIGLIPIPIPNSLVGLYLSKNKQLVLDRWLETLNIEVLILSGGNDIGDSPQRDLTENCLLSWAEKNRKPVLGICRGMQIMGVYAGGKLIKVDEHVRTRHKLEMSDNNKDIFPESVNSYHNHALKECPNTFEILAKSKDGNLEAMKHKKLPWEAWMWHPEREERFSINNQERFKRLINIGK
jgi:N5-(cytidine 5'-diphosphoramidyl)-L-glutamine hydrolase